jgi:maleylpyruvate isomerase
MMTGVSNQPEPLPTAGTAIAAHSRLRATAARMTEQDARAASLLPGWTRGHLLTHLADVSTAFARQADNARRGEVRAVYAGGREGRNNSIEAGSGLPIEELRARLDQGLSTLETAWAQLTPADWQQPCGHRDQPLTGTAAAWWRESELHLVDLDVGYQAQDWSPQLCAHVIDFLLPRLPENNAVVLVSKDTGHRWEQGHGPKVVLVGPLHRLTAWISGRPTTQLPAVKDNAKLPELGDWP